MKIGIMQPYLFPYFGYFQLIAAVDKFIVYDDVNYIKQGWINRNRILLNGGDQTFTLPLQGASSFKLIREIGLDPRSFPLWRQKFYRTLEQAYHKAAYYEPAMELIRGVLEEDCESIAALATLGLQRTCALLEINTKLIPGSSHYDNRELCGQERVIDLCLKEGGTMYINAAGGRHLYDFAGFEKKGLQLTFIQPAPLRYKQFGEGFVPGLSVIDVLMFNDPEAIRKRLADFQLQYS